MCAFQPQLLTIWIGSIHGDAVVGLRERSQEAECQIKSRLIFFFYGDIINRPLGIKLSVHNWVSLNSGRRVPAAEGATHSPSPRQRGRA